MTLVSPEEFVARVTQAFPALQAALVRSAGALHRQVSDFAAFTQDAKAQGDWPVYERCVVLADQLLANGDAAVAVAMRTEFVSHLDFEGSRGPAAWQMLPAALQAAWRQMDAENRRLMSLPQKGSALAGTGRPDARGRQLRGGAGGPHPKGGPGGKPRGGGGGAKGHRGRRGGGGAARPWPPVAAAA